MSLNRQMRRQQTRQEMQEWVRDGTAEKVRKLSVNGITDKDLDTAYKKGYEEGYLYSATNFFKQMYAAISQELIDAGNSTDDILSFLHGVDRRFAVMFDADEEIQAVFDKIGVRINVEKDSIDRINEVIIHE